MLNQNVAVTFSYGHGAQSRLIRCNWVVYGLEFLGDVEEDLDYTLIEDYAGIINDEDVETVENSVRQTIKVKAILRVSDALWMAKFLASTTKKLIIDGNELEVVNAADRIEFPLVEESNFGANPELLFRVKTPGLVTMSESVGYFALH